MGGIIGRLLHEFAVTIGMAVLVSGFVSLSLTPMLCSRFLKPSGSEKHGRFYAVSERFYEQMLISYDRSLKLVLARPRATMIIAGLLLLATVYLYRNHPQGVSSK